MPRLSLLICALACRQPLLARLLARLDLQVQFANCGKDPVVDVLIECDNAQSTIGEKRNRLIDRATGDYLAFIDDDDLVSEQYVPLILEALQTDVDCVGFRSRRFEDGQKVGDCTYSILVPRNGEVLGPKRQWLFSRTPSHLCPIRRQHVMATRFQPWNFGEDRDFAQRVLPLLKTEKFIDRNLYDYLLRSSAHRAGEVVHPSRWHDENARITASHKFPANV